MIRIRYTGIDNNPPIVELKFDESREYDVGDEVSFDGSGSSDPEGNPLTFKWFFGDGSQSSEISPTHVYEEPGEYKVTLFVEDSMGQIQQLSKAVAVGDPPVATIISPSEGDEFYVGQVLTVVGEAFHLNGTKFEDSELVWEVRKHHDVSLEIVDCHLLRVQTVDADISQWMMSLFFDIFALIGSLSSLLGPYQWQ